MRELQGLFLCHLGTFCNARFPADDDAPERPRMLADIARTFPKAGGRLSLHDREPHGLIVRMLLPLGQQPRLAA